MYGCKRLQSVEIPCEEIIIDIRKIVALKLITGSLKRGREQPLPIRTPQHGVGKHFKLGRTIEKIIVPFV
jgi:hypothetical protein